MSQENELLTALLKSKEIIELLVKERDEAYQEINKNLTKFPVGHYYSPYPDLEDIKAREHELFDDTNDQYDGINLNMEGQLELLKQLSLYHQDIPFPREQTGGMNYYFDNEFYSYGDGVVLYALMRHLKPKKIIEVGSGFSSSLMLDTNRLFFDDSIQLTFIEPYPLRLNTVVKDQSINLIEKQMQDVELSVFKELQEGDILFIDSSHVVKAGSDVQYLFNKILPNLAKGVYVHIHDIPCGFEYPKEWIYARVAFNEAYMLRSFLQFNNAFEIVFWGAYMQNHHHKELETNLPLAGLGSNGSIWLRKNE